MVWSLRKDLDGGVTAPALVAPAEAPKAFEPASVAWESHVVPITAATGDGESAAMAGINQGSHAGLSEVMTYTRDLVDGRYEYTGNQLVDAVLFGPRWTVTNITFSFPATAEFYETPYYQPGHLANHIPFNAAQQTAARYAFSLLASYTGLTFTEVTESADTHGIIRMSQTNDDATLPSAEGNFPGSDASDGDIWFGDNNQPFYLTPAIGNWGQATMMHEIGHTMGLKHGHQDYTGLDLTNGGYLDGPGPHYGTAALPANKDGWAWTVMTYRSAPGFAVAFQGERYNQPQTYMQADIAALQFMYGANFTTNATDSVYTFDATTGEMSINGVGQGAPEFNTTTNIGKIFRTIWDGNGVDTYNLSNFGDNQAIDLRPGQFSTFSQAQLGDSRPLLAGFTGQPGNIANALLYQGDVRSLIENAIAGSGNDTIVGNQAANALTGNGGNDLLDGGAGDDVMTGGLGDDTYGVDSVGDSVVESSGQGTDLVAATISYTLGDEVEHLTLTGTGAINGTGNGLANRITGGAGSNVLNGLDGNDTLIGSYDYRTPAQTIDETTLAAHATLATALALSPSGFGVNSDSDILNSTTAPHITVVGNGGGAYDVYSFLVEAAGVVGTFDIDLTAALDSFIQLYDAAGTLLAYNDDAAMTAGAGGSYDANDSLISYSFAAAGTYYLRVGRFATATTAAVLNAGQSYVLQVSLAGNAPPPLLDGNDTMDGGAGNDSLTGGLGDDYLDGGLDSDLLDGGSGNDTYVVDNAADMVSDASGTDLVMASVTWTAGAGIENLALTGSSDIDATGNALANVVTGNSGANRLDGGAGADTLAGGAGNDSYVVKSGDVVTELASGGTDTVLSAIAWTLSAEFENLTLTGAGDVDATGNGMANLLTGNSGANRLDGGAEADTLVGGSGNDTYVVSAGDVVTELPDAGTDTVLADITWTLSDDVETLILTGTGDIDGTGNGAANLLTGNSGANRLDGGVGADSLAGGAGNDTYVVDAGDVVTELAGEGTDTILSAITWSLSDDFENLSLTGSSDIDGTGNAVANAVTGNSGANRLDGGAGADSLAGGGGNDTYVVDAGDVVTELTGEGTDTVLSALTWTLSDHVENLTLTGSSDIDGTGNSLANSLTGNSGANGLDGGTGADTLAGGLGNDTYVVDDTGDVVSELSNQGSDTVRASVTYSLVGKQIETVVLTGASAINATGNSFNNLLAGNDAANVLNGSTGSDTLNGMGGNDSLIGGTGADVMSGGLGDDSYVIDDAGDTAVEVSGEGTDLVQTALSWTLGDHIENLTLTGSATVNATGNALNNLLTGNSAGNRLDGGAGADSLAGGGGNDTYVIDASGDLVTEGSGAGTDLVEASVSYALAANVENLTLTGAAAIDGTGNGLNNVLIGNSGVNILSGGLGNDTYYVQTTGDNVVEASGAGTDVIYSTITYSLTGRYAETIILTGSAKINATGNSLANTLTGNDGTNTINGKGGADILAGGLGADIFMFDTASGTDTITDFSGAQNDRINIHAYTVGVANSGLIVQSGADVVITLGGGNVITVLNAGQADVLSHIIW